MPPPPVCRGVCSEKQVPGPLPACSPSAQPHRHPHVLTGGLLCAPCSPTETSGPRPRSPSPAQMQDPSPHHTHNGLLLRAPGQGPHLGQTHTHPEPPPLLAEPPPRPDSCSPSGSSSPGQAGTLAEPLGHVPRSSRVHLPPHFACHSPSTGVGVRVLGAVPAIPGADTRGRDSCLIKHMAGDFLWPRLPALLAGSLDSTPGQETRSSHLPQLSLHAALKDSMCRKEDGRSRMWQLRPRAAKSIPFFNDGGALASQDAPHFCGPPSLPISSHQSGNPEPGAFLLALRRKSPSRCLPDPVQPEA